MGPRLVLRIWRRHAGRSNRTSVRQAEPARILFIPPDRELVPRGSLQRKPHTRVFPCAVRLSLVIEVGLIGPLVWVASVRVRPQPSQKVPAALIARVHEEPEPIPHDRPTLECADVP